MKKIILAALTVINLSSFSLEACCNADDSIENDYNSLAASIQNLVERKPRLNTEQDRRNFIIESGKIIEDLPSFYNLFHIEDSIFNNYGEVKNKLMMIARDLISKSLNKLDIGPDFAPTPYGAELRGYIVKIIKQVKSDQNCCCVIL